MHEHENDVVGNASVSSHLRRVLAEGDPTHKRRLATVGKLWSGAALRQADRELGATAIQGGIADGPTVLTKANDGGADAAIEQDDVSA